MKQWIGRTQSKLIKRLQTLLPPKNTCNGDKASSISNIDLEAGVLKQYRTPQRSLNHLASVAPRQCVPWNYACLAYGLFRHRSPVSYGLVIWVGCRTYVSTWLSDFWLAIAILTFRTSTRQPLPAPACQCRPLRHLRETRAPRLPGAVLCACADSCIAGTLHARSLAAALVTDTARAKQLHCAIETATSW